MKKKTTIEDWKKLGYTEKQSEELERLSQIEDNMGDVDAHVMDKVLYKTMKKYESENERGLLIDREQTIIYI